MSTELIFSNDSYDVLLQTAERQLDELWIMFGSYSSREPAGQYFLKERGAQALHIISKTDDWYQHGDLLAVIQLINQTKSIGTRTVAFGCSMGGFGAIAYSGAIGADVVICGAPQTNIDPMITRGSDPRWAANWEAISALGLSRPDAVTTASSTASIYVMYDPMVSPDRWHAERLRRLPNARLIQFRSAGHEVLHPLKHLQLWRPFMRALIENDTTEQSRIRRAFASHRREIPGYYLTLGRALAERQRPRLACSMLTKAIESDPRAPEAYFWKSVALEATGDRQKAIIVLESGIKVIGGRSMYWGLYERLACLIRLENTADVQRVFEIYAAGIAELPNCAGLYFSMGKLYASLALSDSVEFVVKAVELEPANLAYKNLLRILRARSDWTAKSWKKANGELIDYHNLTSALPETYSGSGSSSISNHHRVGFALINSGRAAEATSYFSKLVDQYPKVADYRVFLAHGEWASARQALRSAASAFEAALSLAPQLVDHWGELGEVLVQEGRTSDALVAFRIATEQSRDHPKRAEWLSRIDLLDLTMKAAPRTQKAE